MMSNSPFLKELGGRVRGVDRTNRKVSESKSEGEGQGESDGESLIWVRGKAIRVRPKVRKDEKDQIQHVFLANNQTDRMGNKSDQ